MVEVNFHNGEHQIVLCPNRSMSWEDNRKILIGLLVVNMTIAIGWASMGAWMVLPFAGLEVMMVGVGMYYVSWKLSFKEIITIKSESLIVQKGVYFPKQEWRWQLSNTSLLKQPSSYRMSAPTLFLKHLNERIEIGEFLNRREKATVRDRLNQLGIPITIIAKQ